MSPPSRHDSASEIDSNTRDQMMYNDYIESLRRVEYPMLNNVTYLDHAGTTVPSLSLTTTFAKELGKKLLANPHSSSSTAPSLSQKIVESTRGKVLQLFNADPDHFELVFVANATAGIKLVADAFSGHPRGFEYVYHRDSHTSIVGARELATRSHCFQQDDEVEQWLNTGYNNVGFNDESPKLFAYPAQSNMNGRRLPLSWSTAIRASTRHRNTYTLLDAAALVSTSPLDLSNQSDAPDFVVFSFYKMFGFPDLGGLIVRKAVGHIFDYRRYFGGGTTEMITCSENPWVERKKRSLHEKLEDGTGATHSILALDCAIDTHHRLFGSFEKISRHTGWLARVLYEKLNSLGYANGQEVCRIYKDAQSNYREPATQGATVAFNLRRYDGSWMSSWKVAQLAAERGIHLRAGSLCNPAGMAHALSLSSADMQSAYRSGFRCGQENDVWHGDAFGMVRASIGAMSTQQDVNILVQLIEDLVAATDRSIGFKCSLESRVNTKKNSNDTVKGDTGKAGQRLEARKYYTQMIDKWKSMWKN